MYIGFHETSLSKWIPEGSEQRTENDKHLVVVFSFLGILSHYRSYKIRKHLLSKLSVSYNFGYYQKGVTKYILYPSFSITRMPLCPRN